MKDGETVYLNSGSPLLTVRLIDEDKTTCSWFSGEKHDILTMPTVSFWDTLVDDGAKAP